MQPIAAEWSSRMIPALEKLQVVPGSTPGSVSYNVAVNMIVAAILTKFIRPRTVVAEQCFCTSPRLSNALSSAIK